MGSLRFAITNIDGLLADLNMPPSAYRVFLKLRAEGESGGRIDIDQETIARQLGLSRPCVNGALRTLELAQLVAKVKNGTYQVNPILASYSNLEQLVEVVESMPREERVNFRQFMVNCRKTLADHKKQTGQRRKTCDDHSPIGASGKAGARLVGQRMIEA
ncbi:MarR family transcriptional regulator [Streptomyces collinus]|uniref:MarR family transcriptional regulator n=1 Tax=Streptomyces collinus TaxID=42684 RepID=UPI003695AD64